MAQPRMISFGGGVAAMPPVMARAYAADPRSRLASAILDQGTSTAPLQGGWIEGLSRLGNALLGGYLEGTARRDAQAAETRARGEARSQLADAIRGSGLQIPALSTPGAGPTSIAPPAVAPAAPSAAPTAPPAQGAPQLAQAGQPPSGAVAPAGGAGASVTLPSGGAPQAAAAAQPQQSGQLGAQQLMQLAIAAATDPNPYVQQQAAVLMQMAQLAAQQQNRQTHAPVAVGPNQRLVDPNTGRVIVGPSGGGAGGGAAGGAAAPPGVADLGNSLEGRMIAEYQALDALRSQGRLSPVQAQRLQIIEQHLTAPRVVMGENGPTTITPAQLPRLQAPAAPPPPIMATPGGHVSVPPPQLPQIPDAAPATPAAPAPAGGPLAQAPVTTPLPGGGQITTPQRPAREAPANIVGAMTENANAVRTIDRALAALERNPNAVGILPGLGNLTDWSSQVWNRMDPQGVEARAAIADIGSLRINDRSGAAVTASEFPRLRPFIPQIGDDAATVRTKLQRFRQEYESMLRDQYSVYGPSAGYRNLAPVDSILQPPAPQRGGGGGGAPRVLEFDAQGRRVR